MLGIVLPVVAAPTRQSGHAISPANATNTASTTNAAKVAAIPPASNWI
jgi:hypothetical protein